VPSACAFGDAAARITIHPGPRHDLAYLGWIVDDLDATIAAVEAAGVAVKRGDTSTFTDPFDFHTSSPRASRRGRHSRRVVQSPAS